MTLGKRPRNGSRSLRELTTDLRSRAPTCSCAGWAISLASVRAGEAAFSIADPIRDEQLNLVARGVAERVLAADPELRLPVHEGIRRVLNERYARALELFRVGVTARRTLAR